MEKMKSSTTKRSIPIAVVLISAILIHSTPAFCAAVDGETAYEILEDYNFPIGLLPEGVTGYEFDSTTGKFSVHFNDTCSFSLESSYQMRYKPTVTGYLSNGKMYSLEGIYTRLFFVWKEIVEIVRREDDLVFYVGIFSSTYPINNFETCPRCGCGFNCEQGKSLRTNPLASAN